MKLLNGQELTGYIKERQIHQVRGLRQAHGIQPKLILASDSGSDGFIPLCQDYGRDILVDVEIRSTSSNTSSVDRAKSLAVDWLLAGYNVDLTGKTIRLVNQQAVLDDLVERWGATGCQVLQKDEQTIPTRLVDVLIAPGVSAKYPTSPKAVGIETDSQSFMQLVVCALFDNVIREASADATSN